MANYVYDSPAPTLPTPKTNRAAIPAGEDPTKWVSATDWNLVAQAALDLRTAIRTGGKWFAFEQQATLPNGSATDYLWRDTLGSLNLQRADGQALRVRLERPGAATTSDAGGQVQDVTAATLGGDGEAQIVRARVAVINSDSADAAGLELTGVFKRTGGVVTQVGSTNILKIPPAAPADATYVIVGADVKVRCTGGAGATRKWSVEGSATRVTAA